MAENIREGYHLSDGRQGGFTFRIRILALERRCSLKRGDEEEEACAVCMAHISRLLEPSALEGRWGREDRPDSFTLCGFANWESKRGGIAVWYRIASGGPAVR